MLYCINTFDGIDYVLSEVTKAISLIKMTDHLNERIDNVTYFLVIVNLGNEHVMKIL